MRAVDSGIVKELETNQEQTEPHDPTELSLSDQSLIVKVRDGDEQAASKLYQRYAQRVFGLVECNLGDRLRASTETEDVVQSVFKSIFRGVKSGHYDAPPSETLWNLIAVIALRKLRRRARYFSAQRRDGECTVAMIDPDEQIASDSSSLSHLELCIDETLQSFRHIDREILNLRIQGHSIQEISEKTTKSRRSVERSLQRTRECLAKQLLANE